MNDYQVLPPLTDDEYQELKADIARRGVMVPVEYDGEGNILDGHHRVKACVELGITHWPRLVRIGFTEEDKWTHARKLNLARRHLTQEQKRGLVREQVKATPELSDRQIAKGLGVSNPTVSSVRKRMEDSGELLKFNSSVGSDGKERPRTTKPRTTYLPAETVAKTENLPEPLREQVLCGQVKPSEAQRQVRAEQRKGLIATIPTGKFAVILADPPWQYSNSGFDESAESQYPTMPTDEICAMAGMVESFTTPETVLFLWATNPLLPDALKVMSAWGFEYKTNMAWIKDRGRGKGWFLKSKHELLLIGVKENSPHPDHRPDSCFEAERGPVHSKKPVEAYSIIDSMYGGKKLEMFCRSSRHGWESHGNECQG